MSEPVPESLTPGAVSGREHLVHLLWETSARVAIFGEPVLAGMQLSQASIDALEHIAASPGITASELGRRSVKTQQAVSQVTARLERLGFIERRVGTGRGVGLHITDAGSQALVEGLADEQQLEFRLRDLVGSERYEELRALLVQTRDLLTDATAD